jgi:hypothetical protein
MGPLRMLSGFIAAACGKDRTAAAAATVSNSDNAPRSTADLRDPAADITVVCGGVELFASKTHSEFCDPADPPTAEPDQAALTAIGLGGSEAGALGSGGAESDEKREEEEGEGVWQRLYLKANEQATDGTSRQRLARLAVALSESSSSSAWFTRCEHCRANIF